ncbi:S41 family peptidase [Hymenobacter guriensis]|uniref:Tail specific protease domain-containing protein n=1 Tax=Hymenobacter guriensis TaxID=2793065 RepID=A0ABS0L946_9BACT|nr:S41 family peptidase [Hymenobacter guriensis]MBG8556123.1 hypothetical protein [Hymenobacter guriensis]
MKNLRLATLVVALLLPSLARAQGSQKAATQVRHLLDSLELRLKTNYVFPDKATFISKHLRSQVKKHTYASLAKEPEKLAVQIQADIYTAHRDPHMAVEYNPALAQRIQRSDQESEEETLQFAQWEKDNNFMFKKVELLPGNIGYFPFTIFVGQVKEAKPIIASALGFLANSSAIIIDLRENNGGQPEMVSQLESYFFKEKTRMNSVVTRANQDRGSTRVRTETNAKEFARVVLPNRPGPATAAIAP